MAEYKIIISGPIGAGKSTALAAVSDCAPVTTEAHNSRRADADKATTTVALDYGEVALGDGDVLRLYGTPGQERFDFMRQILARGALGFVILLDAQRADPAADLRGFLADFTRDDHQLPCVVGVTKTDLVDNTDRLMSRLYAELDALHRAAPCFSCDVRERGQVLALLDALLALIEVSPPDDAHAGASGILA